MSDVRLSMQEVEGFEEISHHRLHKLFGEQTRFAARSLKREQGGLKRLMYQTLMDTAAGTFEAEHIDDMADLLRSRMRCGHRIDMVVKGDLAINFPRRSAYVHFQHNILAVSRLRVSRSYQRTSRIYVPYERSRQNHTVEFAPNPSLPITS